MSQPRRGRRFDICLPLGPPSAFICPSIASESPCFTVCCAGWCASHRPLSGSACTHQEESSHLTGVVSSRGSGYVLHPLASSLVHSLNSSSSSLVLPLVLSAVALRRCRSSLRCRLDQGALPPYPALCLASRQSLALLRGRIALFGRNPFDVCSIDQPEGERVARRPLALRPCSRLQPDVSSSIIAVLCLGGRLDGSRGHSDVAQ